MTIDVGRNVFRPEKVAGHVRTLATWGEHVYISRPLSGHVLRPTDANADRVAHEQTSVTAG